MNIVKRRIVCWALVLASICCIHLVLAAQVEDQGRIKPPMMQSGLEKHVEQIRAEEWPASISSALCERVRTSGHPYQHLREVDPDTLEKDLSTLMDKSDEVLLTGGFIDSVDVLSPSGNDVVRYFDARVLRTFKGSRKQGELVTYALPEGSISCDLTSQHALAVMVTAQPDLGMNPERHKPGLSYHQPTGPYLLFLRQSKGDEASLMRGLILSAGDGMQGMFFVYESANVWTPSGTVHDCFCAIINDPRTAACGNDINNPENIARCNARISTDKAPVEFMYRRDPLVKKYDGIPFSQLLREVEAITKFSTVRTSVKK